MRLGLLGGTFDPPHVGHLILAEVARDQLGLDRVLWIPAADPPHKQGRIILPIYHRLAMLRLALAANRAFEVSLIDVERPGPHYTTDTLVLIATQHPGADLVFLIGGDSLRDLLTWHKPAQIIKQAWLGVMPRPGVHVDLAALEGNLPGLSERLLFVDAPLLGVSGAAIRERAGAGRTIRYLLPAGVEAYIHEHGLYRDAGQSQTG